MASDLRTTRADFPVFQTAIHGKPIVYLDSACMALKPKQVISAIASYYNETPACAGRSGHALSKMVEEKISSSRKSISAFFSSKPECTVFTRNTTEAINLVAKSFPFSKDGGDVVLTLDKEHNSNLLPWQQLAKQGAIKHRILKTNEDGTFDMAAFRNALADSGKRLRLVAFGHTSNMDGVTIPAKEIIEEAHSHGAMMLLDGAQFSPHHLLNFKKLGADFYTLSFHKMYGPTGMGALLATPESLKTLKPFIVGGGTVSNSTFDTAEYMTGPEMFEAGLQDYAGIIGAGAAAGYLSKIGMENVQAHETKLNSLLTTLMQPEIDSGKISLLGPQNAESRSSIFSFIPVHRGMTVHETGLLLSESDNIFVRAGMHCVHSWFNSRKLPGSVRVSFGIYNTEEDVRQVAEKLKQMLK